MGENQSGDLLRLSSFFTGKQKLVDTAGRIEKFKQRYAKHFEQKGK